MPILSCNNISKTYIVDTILENISFTIADRDKIGLLGLNGSGKTTLINILAGDIDKDHGDIYIKRDLKIGYLKQHVKIESENTIFADCLEIFQDLIEMEEYLRSLEAKIALEGSSGHSQRLDKLMNEYGSVSEKFTSANGYGYESDIKGVLKGLGFMEDDFSKKVNLLSGGQKSRLALGKMLLQDPDLLLLDEPTNHLAIGAINWLEGFLKDFKGAVLVISHDRHFLDSLVNKIFYLENRNITIYNSDYTGFMKQRKSDLELLKKQYQNQQKEIKRQEEIINRFMNYGGSRYIRQAQSRQKLLDKMKVLDRPHQSKKARIKFETQIKSGRDVLSVEHLSKSFDDF